MIMVLFYGPDRQADVVFFEYMVTAVSTVLVRGYLPDENGVYRAMFGYAEIYRLMEGTRYEVSPVL